MFPVNDIKWSLLAEKFHPIFRLQNSSDKHHKNAVPNDRFHQFFFIPYHIIHRDNFFFHKQESDTCKLVIAILVNWHIFNRYCDTVHTRAILVKISDWNVAIYSDTNASLRRVTFVPKLLCERSELLIQHFSANSTRISPDSRRP